MNSTYLHRMSRFPLEPANTLDDQLAEAFTALAPLMVGVRRQTAPPVFLGRERLHRMHVLVMNASNPFPAPAPADDLEQVLPRLNRWPLETQARPVLGEILRGERGEWYEYAGGRIRRLHQLVAGADGEVLEVPSRPVAPASSLTAGPRVMESPSDEDVELDDEAERPAHSPGPLRPRPAAALPPPFRMLLAPPGAWRVVALGAFKPILAPQLAQPARLRDGHRLPCQVQVFEATASQPMEILAHAILGDQAGPVELQPLTAAVVAQLGLAALLPAPAGLPPFVREQGDVRVGQRFFRLTVASDPTATLTPTQSVSPEASSPVVAPLDGPVLRADPIVSGLRTEIPATLLRPWEFRRTRDEALASLQRARSWLRRLTRPWCRLRHHAEFQKWQLLLSGRSADEQLWTVPPPDGWLGDPWLRDWARRTLQLGGYDSDLLLAEWEVTWARKVSG